MESALPEPVLEETPEVEPVAEVEEVLDLLADALLADLGGGVAEERGVELRQRKVADWDAGFEVDGGDAMAQDVAGGEHGGEEDDEEEEQE